MSKNIIIIGNTVAADIIYGLLIDDSRYNVIGFAVDEEFIQEKNKFQIEVMAIENLLDRYDPKDCSVMLGIGYSEVNQIRERMFTRLINMGFTIETYIHPTAVVSSTALIGEGSVIMANTVIEPFVAVGNNSMIWSNCTIAHHSKVESHCWIASNSIISGQASVLNNTFIGVSCTVVNEVIVEEFNIIGAGSLITKNTKKNDVYLTRSSEKHRFDSINYSKFFLK